MKREGEKDRVLSLKKIMKKRIITLLTLLVLLPVMAFATEVVITWEWMLDDPQITGFRYQLNSEDPDNWTVVDGMTSSCVIQNLDGSVEHTLYLQQTYDGVNWSPSAVSVALPLFEADEEVALEQEMPQENVVEEAEVALPQEEGAVAVEEEKAVTDEDSEVVVDEEKVEDVVVEEATMDNKSTSNYYTSISLRGSGAYTISEISGMSNDYDQYSAALGIGLGFNNIVSFNKVGLGLNIDTDLLLLPYSSQAKAALFSFFTDTSIYDFSLRVTIAPELEFDLNKVNIDIAPFVDANIIGIPLIGNLDIAADLYSHFVIGYGAKLGLNYNVNDKIQLGVATKFRKYGGMADWNVLDEWGVEVTPTLTFKF